MRNVDKVSWKIINSLWLITVFIFLLNWTAFMFIGARVKKKKWLIFGFVYFAITALFMVSVNSKWNTADFWTGTYMISWLVCIIHAFLARNEFLQRLYQMDEILANAKQEVVKTETPADNEVENKVLAAGIKKIDGIKTMAMKMESEQLKDKLISIIEQAEKIVKELKEKPEEIRKANKFLNYYLDATENIITKYIKLKDQGLDSEAFGKAHENFVQILDTIEIAFQKQMERLLEDDLFDLEAEMAVLDKTIKSEELI